MRGTPRLRLRLHCCAGKSFIMAAKVAATAGDGGEDSTAAPKPTPIETLTQLSMAGNVLVLFVRGNW